MNELKALRVLAEEKRRTIEDELKTAFNKGVVSIQEIITVGVGLSLCKSNKPTKKAKKILRRIDGGVQSKAKTKPVVVNQDKEEPRLANVELIENESLKESILPLIKELRLSPATRTILLRAVEEGKVYSLGTLMSVSIGGTRIKGISTKRTQEISKAIKESEANNQ